METRNNRLVEHYRDIPVVNLLPSTQAKSLRVFGAEGRLLLVRAGLAGVVVVAALLLMVFNAQEQSNLDAVEDSLRRSAAADATIDEALDLEAEIAGLRAVGDVSGRDFDYLQGDSGLVMGTIRSVFELDIAGVAVTNVEMLGPDTVSVVVQVDSNSGAIQWRSRLPDMPGVERVLSFDPVESDEGPLTYLATLVAGGSQ